MGTNARNAKVKVVIADADDWKGLYINGKLIKQDHRIEPRDILTALGVEHFKLDVDSEWMDGRSHLPEDLDEVQFNATPAEIKKATK